MNITVRPIEGEYFAGDSVQVTVLDHPMAKRRIELAPVGSTVGEIVRMFSNGRECSVTADGRRITSGDRDSVIAMQSVQIVCVPGKGLGSFFRQIATLLLAIAAAFIAPYLAAPIIGALSLGASAGMILTGAITAGLTMLGSIALNALFPTAQPQLESSSGTTYSISGGRNRANPFGPIPTILGTHRVAPPYAGATYTEILGDDQYLTVPLCWGYGPVKIEDLKIGETDLDDFDDVEIETFYGYDTDSEPTLYPEQVIEEQLSIELDTDVENIRTTANDADRIVVDIQAPGGIFDLDDKGRYLKVNVTFTIEIRDADADEEDPWELVLDDAMSGNKAKAQRESFEFDVDRGQYDVRVIQTRVYANENRANETIYWTALRSITNESPINAPEPLAITVLRIRATSQLSGAIETLNGIVTGLVTSWDATAGEWQAEQESSNPADLFRHVLQSPANKKAVADSEIDLDTLQDWHDYCETQGFTFNQYRDFRASVWSTLMDICAAGRATVTFLDGKWSVIWDDADAPIVQHFTPANSSGFKASRGYADKVKAFRARFIDADNSWQEDERLIFADGYDEDNTDRYEQIEFPGVTDSDLVWRHGRYHIAQIELRREVYELTTDFEHLACVRGDRVLLTHDVPRIGLGFGRIKSVDGETVTLDSAMELDDTNTFVLRIRLSDGTSSTRTIETAGPVETDTLDLVTDAAETAPQAGDLFAFGYFDTESTVCRVKAIRPMGNLAARLELVDDAPDIHDADTGTIPAFDPNISEPVDLYGYPPGSVSGTSFLEVVDGTLVAGVNLSWTPPAASGVIGYIYQYKQQNDDWSSSVEVTGTAATVGDLEGGTYFFRVKAVFADAVSDWSNEYSLDVDGPYLAPSDVENFLAIVSGTNLILSWDAVLDTVFRDYEIRHTSDTDNPTWSAASSLRTEFTSNSLTIPYLRGSFLIRARSWNDVYSDNATIVIVNVTPISEYNVVETLTDEAPYPGTHSETNYDSVYEAIILAATADYFDPADFFAEDDFFQGGERVGSGTYTLADRIDLTAEMTVRLSADVSAGGVKFSDDLFTRTDFFTADDFFGNDPSLWTVTAQVRTTSDDPDDVAASWSEWADLVVGDYTARAFEFRLCLETESADFSPVVTDASFTADVPDRIISFDDVASGAAAYALEFDPPFYALKDLQITTQDMQTGDYWSVTGKSASGATIAFFDGNNNAVSRSFDAHAFGYGSLQ